MHPGDNQICNATVFCIISIKYSKTNELGSLIITTPRVYTMIYYKINYTYVLLLRVFPRTGCSFYCSDDHLVIKRFGIMQHQVYNVLTIICAVSSSQKVFSRLHNAVFASET